MGQQQGREIEVGADGKKYYVVPGSDRKFPVDEIDGTSESNPPRLSDADPPQGGLFGDGPSGRDRAMLRGFMQGARESPTGKFIEGIGPEIGAGLAAALAPETYGATLWGPPVAAAGVNAVQQYMGKGSVDPHEVVTRGGVNAIPGAVGKVSSKFMPGSGVLARAVEEAAQGDTWVGNIAKGLKGAMGGGPSPAVASAAAKTGRAGSQFTYNPGAKGPASAILAALEQKLQDPTLNTTAKAAVYNAIKRMQSEYSGKVALGLRSALGLGEATFTDQK